MGNLECCESPNDLGPIPKPSTTNPRKKSSSSLLSDYGSNSSQCQKLKTMVEMNKFSGSLLVQSFQWKFEERFTDQIKKSSMIDLSKICFFIDQLSPKQNETEVPNKDPKVEADSAGVDVQSTHTYDTYSNGSKPTEYESQRHRYAINNKDVYGVKLHECKRDHEIVIKLIYLHSSILTEGYLNLSEKTVSLGAILEQQDEKLEFTMNSQRNNGGINGNAICNLKIRFQFFDSVYKPRSVSQILRMNKGQQSSSSSTRLLSAAVQESQSGNQNDYKNYSAMSSMDQDQYMSRNGQVIQGRSKSSQGKRDQKVHKMSLNQRQAALETLLQQRKRSRTQFGQQQNLQQVLGKINDSADSMIFEDTQNPTDNYPPTNSQIKRYTQIAKSNRSTVKKTHLPASIRECIIEEPSYEEQDSMVK